MKIQFNTDNDAFIVNNEAEVSRILSRISYEVLSGEECGTIRDLNGNKVGSWSAIDDEVC